jgi:hypothetical protein
MPFEPFPASVWLGVAVASGYDVRLESQSLVGEIEPAAHHFFSTTVSHGWVSDMMSKSPRGSVKGIT